MNASRRREAELSKPAPIRIAVSELNLKIAWSNSRRYDESGDIASATPNGAFIHELD
jgi:hypothetical protein